MKRYSLEECETRFAGETNVDHVMAEDIKGDWYKVTDVEVEMKEKDTNNAFLRRQLAKKNTMIDNLRSAADDTLKLIEVKDAEIARLESDHACGDCPVLNTVVKNNAALSTKLDEANGEIKAEHKAFEIEWEHAEELTAVIADLRAKLEEVKKAVAKYEDFHAKHNAAIFQMCLDDERISKLVVGAAIKEKETDHE